MKQIRKRKITKYTQIFHGNKAMQQFRLYRDIHEQMRVWQQHHEPELFYEIEYKRKKLKGKHNDDWRVDYQHWSPTKGESVELEWLQDIKSSISQPSQKNPNWGKLNEL